MSSDLQLQKHTQPHFRLPLRTMVAPSDAKFARPLAKIHVVRGRSARSANARSAAAACSLSGRSATRPPFGLFARWRQSIVRTTLTARRLRSWPRTVAE